MHPKAHDTLWRVLFLNSGITRDFETEEGAKIVAFEYGAFQPVRVIPPIYG